MRPTASCLRLPITYAGPKNGDFHFRHLLMLSPAGQKCAWQTSHWLWTQLITIFHDVFARYIQQCVLNNNASVFLSAPDRPPISGRAERSVRPLKSKKLPVPKSFNKYLLNKKKILLENGKILAKIFFSKKHSCLIFCVHYQKSDIKFNTDSGSQMTGRWWSHYVA